MKWTIVNIFAVQRRVTFSTHMLTAIVRCVSNEPTQAKVIVFEGLGDSLSTALGFFRIYVGAHQCTPVLENLLDFFLATFEALPSQVGVPFTQQTIATFLEKLAEQKQAILASGTTASQNKQDVWSVVLVKLLEIITVVMSSPSNKFESLLPNIVSTI